MFLRLSLLFLLVSASTLRALPMQTPIEASLFERGILGESRAGGYRMPNSCYLNRCSFRVGFYGDYVFNHYLENSATNQPIECVKTYTNSGYVALNVFDNMDFFATVGATKLLIETPSDTLGFLVLNVGGLSHFDFSSALSWSVGARTTVWQCGGFGVGVEGQYFQTRPTLNFLDVIANINYPTEDVAILYKQWQVGLGACYSYSLFCPSVCLTPYVGLTANWVRIDTNDLGLPVLNSTPAFVVLEEMKSSKIWGFAFGVSCGAGEVALITAEGRFGNEKAFSISGQFAF